MEQSLKKISPDFPHVKDIVDKSYDLTGGRFRLIDLIVGMLHGRIATLSEGTKLTREEKRLILNLV